MMLALIIGLAGPAQAREDYRQFTWGNDIHAGDCTMFRGATWTLRPDGTAWFRGLVTSSDDNDAWLQWVDLKGANGRWLGRLVANTHWDDLYKFVLNLPDSSRQYPWSQRGTYPPELYRDIQSLTMLYRC